MTKASDVRDFFKEGRRLVEQDLDIAEQFKAMRDAARTKNVDWSQVKALLKAQILDEREGTDKRVRAIVEKADCASAYADMLGLSEKNKTREENCAADVERDAKVGTTARMAQTTQLAREMADAGMISQEAAEETAQMAAAVGKKFGAGAPDEYYAIPADLSIPPFLKREPATAN